MKEYKSFRTLLQSKINIAKKNHIELLYIAYSELLRDYDTFNPKDKPIEIEIIQGWKGTGTLDIYKGVDNDFICVEHIKDKISEKIEKRSIEIKKEDLNKIINIIGKLKIGEKISCYQISKELGWNNWKDLWRERKIYFKTYYYCLKILEKLKMIEYGARSSKRLI